MDLPGLIIFGLMAVLVIGSALGMLLSRRAIYSALFLVLNFGCVAVLYLLLGAPFIALAQVTVYAGAIMILFLFVIMLLGTEALPSARELRFHRLAAAILGLGFLIELILVAAWKGFSLVPLQPMTADLAGPKGVGLTLFQQFALPVEITSLVLLVGIVGAIALTGRLHGEEREFYFLRRKARKPAATAQETAVAKAGTMGSKIGEEE